MQIEEQVALTAQITTICLGHPQFHNRTILLLLLLPLPLPLPLPLLLPLLLLFCHMVSNSRCFHSRDFHQLPKHKLI
jgi:hypothetical protein